MQGNLVSGSCALWRSAVTIRVVKDKEHGTTELYKILVEWLNLVLMSPSLSQIECRTIISNYGNEDCIRNIKDIFINSLTKC